MTLDDDAIQRQSVRKMKRDMRHCAILLVVLIPLTVANVFFIFAASTTESTIGFVFVAIVLGVVLYIVIRKLWENWSVYRLLPPAL